MTAQPFGSIWRGLVQKASSAVLRRQKLSPDALAGRRGEEAAYWHLRRQGFVMVERNYRPKGLRGEIDLIGWEGDVLVFVEVKARRAAVVVTPEAAVDWDKQQNLIAAAGEYRRRANLLSKPFRFDIISIVAPNTEGGGESRADIKLQHFRDAFRDRAE